MPIFGAAFFNDAATAEIYTGEHTLPLHAALPIGHVEVARALGDRAHMLNFGRVNHGDLPFL